MVGSDKNISGIDNLMSRIFDLIGNTTNLEVIEGEIKHILIANLEGKYLPFRPDDIMVVTEAFSDVNERILRALFWGLLSGHHIAYPKTRSLDLNNYIMNLLAFIGESTCTFDCEEDLIIIDKDGRISLEGNVYKPRNKVIKKTKLVKKLIRKGMKNELDEFRTYYQSAKETIEQFVQICNTYHTGEQRFEMIDEMRKMIGRELEYFSLQKLRLKNPEVYEMLVSNTSNLEWVGII